MSDVVDTGAIDAPEASAEEVIESIDQSSDEVVESSEEVDVEEASEEELEDVVEDADASEEDKQEAVAELQKRLTLKVNGKDEDFDLSDDSHLERLKQMAQKGDGADKKFQEAADLRKKMEAFAEILQNGDIGDLLTKVGRDPNAEIEKFMAKRIEEMQKSPEQLELEQMRAKLEERDNELKRIEDEKHESEQARVSQEYERQLEDEISEGLESSTLPKSPIVVRRIAENLMMAIENGYEDVSVADILPIVEKQIQDDLRQMLEIMPEDVIEEFLGDTINTKLRKRRVKRTKKAPTSAASVKATGQSEIKKAEAEENKEVIKQSAKDFFNERR